MTSPSEAVLFDFGGTLDANGVAWKERFASIYRQEGLRVPAERFDRAFYDSDDNLPLRFALAGKGLEETVRLQVGCVLEHLGGATDPDLAERVTRRFVAESLDALRRNRGLLARLRARCRLGIVSNFYGNLEDVLASVGYRELFDVVADSERVGAVKPDRALFEYALRALGAEPAAAWMVGDSLKRDIRGAEALGLRHAWLVGDRLGCEPCCPRGNTLRSLDDLEPLLTSKRVRA